MANKAIVKTKKEGNKKKMEKPEKTKFFSSVFFQYVIGKLFESKLDCKKRIQSLNKIKRNLPVLITE